MPNPYDVALISLKEEIKEFNKFVKMIGAEEMYNDVKFIDNNFNN